MLISCKNRELNFSIDAPPSKSIYHRELIIRFLCGETDRLEPVAGDNDDVLATKACLKALLSAKNHRETPASLSPDRTNDIYLPCNESGSTLRFMIPVAAAYLLGDRNSSLSQGDSDSQNTDPDFSTRLIFQTEGRLFDRPIKELQEALFSHGIIISRNEEDRTIIVTGRMTPGEYIIGGSVSSQYISGLLMALTCFTEPCSVMVLGEIKSIHYIELTQAVLRKYGVPAELSENIYTTNVGGYKPLADAPVFHVEGDWSNGAFLLCLKEFTKIEVGNLVTESKQGDVAILRFLASVKDVRSSHLELQADSLWDCKDIPDITPYMAVTAAFVYRKATFTGIERLRIKESDRISAVREQLSAIGIRTEETENTLTVFGKDLKQIKDSVTEPLVLSSHHDHRMAMCAVLITAALGIQTEIDDVECMNKSFPQFVEIVERYFKP